MLQTTDNDSSGDPISMLTAYNLTRLEASVYLGLLMEGEMNGYEAAKSLGVSRSNAYTALAGLVEKGAAWITEGRVTRYTPVPPSEFCSNRVRHLARLRDQLIASLPERRTETNAYLTIQGRDHILDRLHHLLAATEQRVYVALEGSILERFSDDLKAVIARGGKVAIITDPDMCDVLKADDAFSGAAIHSGRVEPDQIRVISDSRHVLTGELVGGAGASCLYSNHKHLADLFKMALRNELRLIELGDRLPEEE